MMNEHLCEKIIEGKCIIYDRDMDVIKFSCHEKVNNHYSNERLAQVAPYKTDIEITKKCNQNCIHCFARCDPSESSQDMRYFDLMSYIREREKNIIRLVITGGEPFLHPNINELLNLPIHFPDINFVICSNGTNIDNAHIALLSHFHWLTILSIHGSSTTHNRYTRFNSYEKVTKVLEKLTAETRVKIYSVINEYSTEEDIEHLFKLKEKYQVGAMKFMTPRGSNNCKASFDEKIVEYVKTHLDETTGLQEISSNTEFITVSGTVKDTG